MQDPIPLSIVKVLSRNPATLRVRSIARIEGEDVMLRSAALEGNEALCDGVLLAECLQIDGNEAYAEALRRPPRQSYAIDFLRSDLFSGVPGPVRRAIEQRAMREGATQVLRHIEDGSMTWLAQEVGAKVIQDAAPALDHALGRRDGFEHLRSIGYSSGQAVTILQAHGERAVTLSVTSPYLFSDTLPGIDLDACDRAAMTAGIPPDSDYRGIALTRDYVLRNGPIFRAGECHEELGRSGVDIAAGLEHLERTGIIVPVSGTEDTYTWRGVADLGRNIAKRLRILAGSVAPAIPEVGRSRADYDPGDDQDHAVATLLRTPVGILTGGPGTGKTTVLKRVANSLAQVGEVLLAAPTGKAARRMTEATGRNAKTIHRLLGYRDGKFTHNRDNPLNCAAILVDESSMIDEQLCGALLDATRMGTRLLFAGDPQQLPPVGRGETLRVLIDTHAVPIAELTKVRRQGAGSQIATGAAAIRRRERPTPPATDSDWCMRPGSDPLVAILDEVTRVAPARAGCEPVDIVVVAARKEGPLGMHALNRHLQAAINPAHPQKVEMEISPTMTLRVGDRVRQTKNDYRLGVMNGECGRIEKIEPATRSVRARMEGREVQYDLERLSNLTLGYCSTVHAAQGSEFPGVVMLLDPGLTRPLVYTALTRAQRYCCFIGDQATLDQAVRQEEFREPSPLYGELIENRVIQRDHEQSGMNP